MDATPQAVTDALALVGTTARVVLPVGTARELYVALSDTSATALLTKIASVVTISGVTSAGVYLAYGETSVNATFPTYATVVDDYVGFSLLTTTPANTVTVYEAALEVAGVIGVAIVAGNANILVEATASTSGAVDTILDDVDSLSGATEVARAIGPVSGGAGFP